MSYRAPFAYRTHYTALWMLWDPIVTTVTIKTSSRLDFPDEVPNELLLAHFARLVALERGEDARAPRFGGVAGEPRVRVAPFFSNASIFGTCFTAFKNVLSLITPRLSMSTMSNTPDRYLTLIRYGSAGLLFESRRRSRTRGTTRGTMRDDPRDDPGPAEGRACVGLGPLARSFDPDPVSETAARAIAARCFASAAFRRFRAASDEPPRARRSARRRRLRRRRFSVSPDPRRA